MTGPRNGEQAKLDAALGSGAKLTEIAQRGGNPYRHVTFKTSWDDLLPEEAEGASPPSDERAIRERCRFSQILHDPPSPSSPARPEPEKGRDI